MAYLAIEDPDREAKLDFLTHNFSVRLKLWNSAGRMELELEVVAGDSLDTALPNELLSNTLIQIPPKRKD